MKTSRDGSGYRCGRLHHIRLGVGEAFPQATGRVTGGPNYIFKRVVEGDRPGGSRREISRSGGNITAHSAPPCLEGTDYKLYWKRWNIGHIAEGTKQAHNGYMIHVIIYVPSSSSSSSGNCFCLCNSTRLLLLPIRSVSRASISHLVNQSSTASCIRVLSHSQALAVTTR